jgi:hypothetical protein
MAFVNSVKDQQVHSEPAVDAVGRRSAGARLATSYQSICPHDLASNRAREAERRVAKSSVGVLQNRDQIGAQMLGLSAELLGHDNLVERNSTIAQQRPQVNSIGQRRGSDQPITFIVYAELIDSLIKEINSRHHTQGCRDDALPKRIEQG